MGFLKRIIVDQPDEVAETPVERVWSSQQLAIFDWFKQGEGNLVCRARAGCLAGDTILNVNRAGKGSAMTIEKVVAQFNGEPYPIYRSDMKIWQKSRPWDAHIETRVARAVDGYVRLGVLAAAWCSGEKQTFTLTTDTGRSIRATAEHPFMTGIKQWTDLGCLKVGDKVFVNVGQGKAEKLPKLQYQQTDVEYHPYRVSNGEGRWKVATHRLVVEAEMNGLSFDEFVRILRHDWLGAKDLTYLTSEQIVHHKDNDQKNNDLRNLMVVQGHKGHAEQHEWGVNVLANIGAETVVSIDPYGVEPVYDLTLRDDPHCFLANGFVVHNCGKTTTIVEGVTRAPEELILVTSFGKRIVGELKQRVVGADVQTLHALGNTYIRRQWAGIRVKGNGQDRADWLTDQVCDRQTPKQIRRLVTQLHTKGREMLPLTYQDATMMTELAYRFDYVPDESWEDYTVGFVVQQAQAAMQKAATTEPDRLRGIDFADMIFLPLVHNLVAKDYDMVVVDEAQDMTVSQLELAVRSCSGRICIVGDDRQAIYGFRGADSQALDRLKSELKAKELPLTATYRCPKAVVRLAQTLVPDLQGLSEHPGVVEEGGYDEVFPQVNVGRSGRDYSGPQLGDFILSRLNAPLVSLILRLLRQGIPAHMAGRDIGSGIEALVRRFRLSATSPIEQLLEKLAVWETRECQKLAINGRADLIYTIEDKAETVRAFATDQNTVGNVLQRCQEVLVSEDQLGDPSTYVLLSSVHKAKGLEADNVYLLCPTFYRNESVEEQNIAYVAMTRAKQRLVFVDPTGKMHA